jgi:hypothetical protein
MRIHWMGMGLIVAVFTASSAWSVMHAYAGGYCFPPALTQSMNPCSPAPPRSYTRPAGTSPVGCANTVPSCQPAARGTTRPFPVPAQPAPVSYPREYSAPTRQEAACGTRLVPVEFRDPGPVKPLVGHLIGATGAAVALPFRILESLCPIRCQPCPAPAPPCGQTGCSSHAFPVGPPVPQYSRPVAACAPVSACPRPLTCAPCGPEVAPLPSSASPPPCGPQIPPALLREY